MAIKRYIANADNTITNAYKEDFNTRGTGSNMGQADILEVFSLYAQRDSGSAELSRVLLKFPITDISSSRQEGTIPASGSVSFYLKMYNAEHTRTLPRDFYLTVAAVSSSISSSWEEGVGMDMENYTDLTYDKIGSNWVNIAGSTGWAAEGGDWYTDNISYYTTRFENGDEDLELDVTTVVEQWINTQGNTIGKKDDHGFIIKLSASYEASSSINLTGAAKSYYTKKFFARSSEFFFERPKIEARWDSSIRDNRGNFHFKSSTLTTADNLNTLYLYNYFKGALKDIAGSDSAVPTMKLYYGSGSVPEGNSRSFENSSNSTVSSLNASRVSKGIYKIQFSTASSAVVDTYPYLFDVWSYSGAEIFTGSMITPKTHSFSDFNPNPKYVVTMPNLKTSYPDSGTERFRLYARYKNWSPSIYTKAQTTPDALLIESASYKIKRLIDDKVVVSYGTSSTNHTVLSYDVSGNYFDLDMSMLEQGYTYGISYSFYEESIGSYVEQPYIFKIRVDKNEY